MRDYTSTVNPDDFPAFDGNNLKEIIALISEKLEEQADSHMCYFNSYEDAREAIFFNKTIEDAQEELNQLHENADDCDNCNSLFECASEYLQRRKKLSE